MSPHLRVLAPLVVVAALVAGCGGSDGSTTGSTQIPGLNAPGSSTPAAPSTDAGSGAPSTSATSATSAASAGGGMQYVALGDSYTAAPGLPTVDPASGSCARSSNDYPHLVAAADSSLVLDDVSCSGANTDDVLGTQLAAVGPDTDLVTVGIGGNDESLFVTVVGGCAQLAASDPTGTPCTTALGTRVRDAITKIRTNVDKVLSAIHAKAPDARVIVVGYPQVLPSDGSSCPDLVPIAPGDYPFVNAMNQGLSQDLQDAAKAAGDDFVDVFGPSKGHDVCSADPWINGLHTAADGVIPFHPFGNEQQAVAGRIAQLLS